MADTGSTYLLGVTAYKFADKFLTANTKISDSIVDKLISMGGNNNAAE